MKYQHHWTLQITMEDAKLKKEKKDMIHTTSILTRAEILSLLLRDSIRTKQTKKKDFFSIANGKIRLIIMKDGLQSPCHNLDAFTISEIFLKPELPQI